MQTLPSRNSSIGPTNRRCNMNTRTWIVMIGILLASSAARAVVADPLYCEAKALNAESNFYRCLARCDRRLAASERFNIERCEEQCQTSMEHALGRIARKPRCRPPTSDPNLCEAQLLKVESQYMACQSRCERKDRRIADFDREVCGTTCEAVADQATAEVLAGVICSDGRPPEATE